MGTTELRSIDAEAMRIAAAGVAPLPIEQSAPWEAFEKTRAISCWGRFEWWEDGKRCALIALYEYRLRGTKYLWAKNGPVWLKEATPTREAAFREDLKRHIRKADSAVAFVRLHAWYSAVDLEDVLQTITYDRTVVISTADGTDDGVLATMTSAGRRAVRKGLKKMDEAGARFVEETGLSAHEFGEYYDVLVETAERDGFRPHPRHYYVNLLNSLGPEHARLFALRTDEGLLCWDLVLVNDRQAQAQYGASTEAARKLSVPIVLDMKVAAHLGSKGIRGLDLMGAHSARVPELFTVGKYKLRFAESATDVAGAWDMPLKPTIYRMLRSALRIKRAIGR